MSCSERLSWSDPLTAADHAGSASVDRKYSLGMAGVPYSALLPLGKGGLLPFLGLSQAVGWDLISQQVALPQGQFPINAAFLAAGMTEDSGDTASWCHGN